MEITLNIPQLSELADAIREYTKCQKELWTGCTDGSISIESLGAVEDAEPTAPAEVKEPEQATAKKQRAPRKAKTEEQKNESSAPDSPPIQAKEPIKETPKDLTVDDFQPVVDEPAATPNVADAPEVTVEQLANAGVKYLNEHPDGVDKLRGILEKHNAKTVRSIPKENFDAFVTDFRALVGDI